MSIADEVAALEAAVPEPPPAPEPQPLPWGRSAAIDYYLTACGHAPD